MTDTSSGGTDENDDPERDRRQLAQRVYDRDEDGDLTTTVVFAIAEAEGVPPTEVTSPTLYDVVDVPAIEAAFFGRETRAGLREGTGTVEFRYTDYLVKIRSDGWVQVYAADGTDAS